MAIRGIDISTYQKNVNYTEVKKDNVKFAILRIGYTGYGTGKAQAKDNLFETHYKGFRQVGMPLGGYFFGRGISAEEGRKEANFVLSAIKGKTFEYPIFYDTEDTYYQAKATKAQNTAACKAFCDTIKAAGYKTGVYSSKYWFSGRLNDKELEGYDRWVAQYNSKCTYTGNYVMWQYSSKAKIKGIQGNVDVNWCYKDYIGENNTPNPVVKPKPVPKPVAKPNFNEKAKKFLHKRGYFKKGDISKNIGLIAKFMRKNFPAYTSKLALGNYFGNYLFKSIKEFQHRTGLEADGNIGPITLAKLTEFGFKY